MAGLTYTVEIQYLESGGFGKKLGELGGRMRGLHADARNFANAITSGLSGAVDVVKDIASTIGGMAIAGVGGIGLMGAAVVNMNGKLEETQISLASIFQSSGVTNGFGQGMAVASTQIAKMRKDAAALPGEFTDLVNIFQSISTSALRGGMSIDQTREMSAKTMALAAIKQISMPVAAREMAALLEGHATSQNVLGRKAFGLTGSKAQAFNRLSEEERGKQLQEMLNKAVSPEALNAFQHSFVGLFTTMKDNIKQVATIFGGPLFGSVKKYLEQFNGWFTNNRPQIDAYAHYLGQKLANGFEYAIEFFKQYGPAIFEFGTNAFVRMHALWLKIEPIVAKVGEHIKNFLADPKALDKIENMAKMMLGFKLAAPMMGNLGRAGFEAMVAGGGLGGIGGLGALASTATIAIPAIAALGAAAYGAALAYEDSGSMFHDAVVTAIPKIEKNLETSGKSLASAFDSMKDSMTGPLEAVGASLTKTLLEFSGALLFATKSMEFFSNGQLMLSNLLFYGNTAISKSGDQLPSKAPKLLKTIDAMGGDKLNPDKNKVPNHVTNINKIEIIVQSNQDPSRIARMTVAEFAKIQKNTKSGFIPKWIGGKS